MSDTTDGVRGRPWLRSWLVVGLAAWATVGVLLVNRANNEGLVEDISFSPYHVVGYAALLTLAVYALWAFFRALRRGEWRRAFPPLYGGLGVGLVLLVTWVVLDPIWRSTLGIRFGIEGGVSPPRLLIPVALVLLAIGPVREAIATRAAPGVAPGELKVRWAGVIGSALAVGSVTLVAFNPISSPLSDFSTNAGFDNSEIWTMAADGSAQTRILTALGDGVDYSLPAWSPDGARIAYTTWTNENGDPQNILYEGQTSAIWTMAVDGSDRRLVVTGDPKLVVSGEAGQAWIPAWSPDGQWIAYALTPVGPAAASAGGPLAGDGPGALGPPTTSVGSAIWIVRPDGSGKRRLTAQGVDAINATWSPDGSKIAYAVGAAGGTSDIHVATINVGTPGTDPSGVEPKLSDDRSIASDPANDWGPSWAPGGATIAFTSNRAGYDSVWIASVDGSSLEELRTETRPGPTGFSDWVPVFSPDGARIAFVSDRSGDAEVWSMAADGSDLRNLSNHPFHFDGTWSVGWSPDGTHLAYAVAAFQDPATSGWVREDLAVAQALLFGLGLSVLALLLIALGAPLGSFTLALLIVAAMSALPTDEWQFMPAAVIAGALVDALVRTVRPGRRARVAAAALPALTNLAIGLTIGIAGTQTWSITLLLGMTLFSGLLGWGLAEAVERFFVRPGSAAEAASRAPA